MKKNLVILFSAILMMQLVACGQVQDKSNSEVLSTESDNIEKGNTDSNYSFAIIVPTTGNEYFQGEIDALQESLDKHGCKLNVISYENDATKLVSVMENLITMGVDGVLVFPMDKDSIDPTCKMVQEAGIKIISGGTTLDYMDALYNTDQEEAGQTIAGMGCDYIKEKYGDESVEVAMIVNTSNSNMVTRCDAMKATLAEECPNTVLVKEIEAESTEDGMSAAENIIQANPDVKVIICVNDAVALGVVEAYNAANISEIAVFGADGTSEGLKKIADGTSLKGTIAFGALDLGDCLVDMVSGEKVDELLSPPIIKITEENIGEYVTE